MYAIYKKETIKTLMSRNKELNKCGDTPYSNIGRLNIFKTSLLHSLIYTFNIILIKISTSYFVGIRKLILKSKYRGKKLRRANNILKEKNKVGELTLSDFKIYYKSTVIETMWY